MVDWVLHTGLYLLGVALVPAVGLLLIWWGLWGDRSKGRARCPRCWYDMRGTLPGLECPECGHDAGSRRLLYRNRRRWGRAVLGVLLVLLLSYPAVIVCGWWREQIVLAACGGQVFASPWSADPIGPDWLVGRLPDGLARFFERWTSVTVSTDQQLALCRKLRYLDSIWVAGDGGGFVSITGGHVKGVIDIQYLTSAGSQVTDAGLVHLKGLTQLRQLSLDAPQVTDAGLVHLKGLTQLEWLYLGETRVTDAGVAKLKRALPEVDVAVRRFAVDRWRSGAR